MAHDVFVSYPTEDKTTADAVVAALEKRGVRCWVAPRDVPPGKGWAAAIVEAIAHARMMVLVFSAATNNSQHILREVREAAEANLTIVPFRTTPDDPTPELRYYIGGTHWLDALTKSLARHIEDLANRVAADLEQDAPEVRSPAGVTPTPVAQPSERSGPRFDLASISPRWKIGGGVAVAAVVIVGGVLLFGGGGGEGTSGSETALDATTTTPSTQATTTTARVTVATWPAEPSSGIAWAQSNLVPSVLAFAIPTIDPQACRFTPDLFACASLYGSGDTYAVALDDFNGDGSVDAVFATGDTNTRCLSVGDLPIRIAPVPTLDADATDCALFANWDPWRTSGPHTATIAVATGDLNGDGRADVVFGNSVSSRADTHSRAEVCMSIDIGDSDGAFACANLPDTEIESDPNREYVETPALAVGDLDADGILDVVLGGSYNTEVCIGFGDGTFACHELESERSFSVSDVALGDFDGDGSVDLILANGGAVDDSQPPRLCLGIPAEPFVCADLPGAASHSTLVAFADIDGDGYSDALINDNISDTVMACPSPANPEGIDIEAVECSDIRDLVGGGRTSMSDLLAGDFTGDGVVDLMIGWGAAKIDLCVGDGEGGFRCENLEWFGSGDQVLPIRLGWAATG